MDGITITKGIVKLVVASGVGTIIGNAVRATTPADMGKLDTIGVMVGSFFLGGMVAEKTAAYSGEVVDSVVDLYRSIRYFGKEQPNYTSKHAGDPTIVDISPEDVTEVPTNN